MTISPLADPRAEAVLGRLHAEDARQFRSMLRRYLPRMILSPFIGSSAMDVSSDSDQAFLRDKLVALDARRAVEVGTSFGVSTIYLAAALRDNAAAGGGVGLVTGTEIEPGKVAAARANLAEAGLDAYAQVREGDALQTLRDIDGPLDFVLIDTWIPLALPALKLLAPRMRHGAVVMCDNVRQFAKEYRDYTDYIRDPANGFRSMLWPGQGGVELSVRTAASVTS